MMAARTAPTAAERAARQAEHARQRQAELFDGRLTTDAGVALSLFDAPAPSSWADEP